MKNLILNEIKKKILNSILIKKFNKTTLNKTIMKEE